MYVVFGVLQEYERIVKKLAPLSNIIFFKTNSVWWPTVKIGLFLLSVFS